ncbi:MAG TPA: hypothetical protein PK329_09710 [Myxococcota bacterium]|nr:hypothetical protein [Myxococcota bacterium]HOS60845.1 hypothetical protein [Myxococcota bacterium]HPL25547.1 hypothetical protein [Myxococcota bacterium]HQE73678.1 hypothetical protein [Myxococcota bacterium]HQI61825.1 hypothetical protein [Myxococcota bacterium]
MAKTAMADGLVDRWSCGVIGGTAVFWVQFANYLGRYSCSNLG